MITLNIFGSCVTRDIFEYVSKEEQKFKCIIYIARSTVVSSVASPIDVSFESIKGFSDWNKRAVYYDLTKSCFKELAEHPSDYLLIDFIDERNAMFRYKDTWITDSVPLRKNADHLFDFSQLEHISPNSIAEELWKRALDKFIESMLNIYRPDQIVLHRALFTPKYLDANNNICVFPPEKINHLLKLNIRLNEMYDYVTEKIGCSSLQMPDTIYASEANKWGLAPMHYTVGYYKFLYNSLLELTGNRDKCSY